MASTLARFRLWAKRLMEAKTVQEKARITVQTDRLFIVRSRRVDRGWCSQCCAEVDLLSPEEAAIMTGASGRTLRESAEAQQWHFCDGSDGARRVCLDSLLKSL